MNCPPLHSWDITPAEARELQANLATQIETTDRIGPVKRVAGIDCGFKDHGKTTSAAIVVMSFPELEMVTTAQAQIPTRLPYIPGLLSFREVPAILEAWGALDVEPDLLLCDGQGIAHPRRFGIACHLGLLLDRPAIGVGKSRLTGEFDPPGEARRDQSPLIHKGETIGMVLRTRDRVRPVFVSPGHRISVESAVDWVMACTPRFRLPEPIRAADRLA